MSFLNIIIPRGSSASRTLALATTAKKRIADGINRAAHIWLRQILINLSKGPRVTRTKRVITRGPNAGKIRTVYPKNPSPHLRRITGNLRGSWRVVEARPVGFDIHAKIVTRSKYARRHEVGYKTRKRPYVFPALAEKRREMRSAMSGSVTSK